MPDPRSSLRTMSRYGVPSKAKEPIPEPVPSASVADLLRALSAVQELARAMTALAEREMPAPVVNVTVEVPKQPTPNVNVEPPVVNLNPTFHQPAAKVDVKVQREGDQVVNVTPNIEVRAVFPDQMNMAITEMPKPDLKILYNDKGRPSGVTQEP